LSLEQWEVFYRGGGVATGPTGADGLYDLEIRDAWETFFDELPTRARLLDLGTGNGVLPLIALSARDRRGAQWEIDATDLARIDPKRFVPDGLRRFEGVRFHPGVANENLPFETGSFDAVIGQYALEYGNTAESLKEVARVLLPRAWAQFILHHSDSVLVQAARSSMAECDLVFKQTRIFRKLHRLVGTENLQNGALQHAQEELAGAIRNVRGALAKAAAAGGGRILSVALDATQQLLAARRSSRAQQVGLEVDRAESELRTSWRRLNDLNNHAVNEKTMQRIEFEANEAGLDTTFRRPLFHNERNLVGWLIRFRNRKVAGPI
jgi:ubiquinone/menaquinone biosynthesis C-methylase UbiE